jgi:Ca2+/H+ antiporter
MLVLGVASLLNGNRQHEQREFMSRTGAFALLLVFGCYLAFFYVTHSNVSLRTIQQQRTRNIRFVVAQSTFAFAAPVLAGTNLTQPLSDLREKASKRPRLSQARSLLILAVSCVLCVVSPVFVVGSKDGNTEALGLSKSSSG